MARGSVVNLAAMALGAVLAFGLTVLVSRWLQPAGAGGFFELIALFTILSNTVLLGADTGLLRWISRARAVGGLADVLRIVVIALLPVLIVGSAAAAAVWLAAPDLARIFLGGMGRQCHGGYPDRRPFRPARCALSLRPGGLTRIRPDVAVPGYRRPRQANPAHRASPPRAPPGLGRAGCFPRAGAFRSRLGSSRAGSSWHCSSRPSQPGCGARAVAIPPGHGGVWIGPQQLRRVAADSAGPRRNAAAGALAADFWRFTGPRGFAGTFQIVVVWLDILLVGAILSRYSAGIYAAVSKLVLVGAYTLEATRLAIAPQLSKFLARHQYSTAAELHQNATAMAHNRILAGIRPDGDLPGGGARHLRASLHSRCRIARHPLRRDAR